MRRKDREVTDFDTIVSIINQCDIMRLGIADGNYPYIVPVNFAYTVEGKQICFYIHGAMAGRKYELLTKNPFCSFEMDIPLGMVFLVEQGDVTMRYKSVMGRAKVEFLDEQEKQIAMDNVIMNRYKETREFDYDRSAMSRCAVAKLTVLEITAKVNPVRK